jgi:pyrroloquinoline quinone (PQQ) biosynthesis protein C
VALSLLANLITISLKILLMCNIDNLVLEAQDHKAVHHPYLIALKDGTLNNPQLAIKDFAIQYAGYTSWFPRFLTAAISKMTNTTHRNHLLDNLNEESGNIDQDELELLHKLGIEDEWVQGISHPELFQRFKNSLGIDSKSKIDESVEIWREMFLDILYNGSEAEVIGAIGIGTESVVKHIYKHILLGIQRHSDIDKYDYVFFELHSEIDDEHGKIMIQIAKDMVEENPNNYHEIRKGMLKALNLRNMFWDSMYERSKKLSNESRREHAAAI